MSARIFHSSRPTMFACACIAVASVVPLAGDGAAQEEEWSDFLGEMVYLRETAVDCLGAVHNLSEEDQEVRTSANSRYADGRRQTVALVATLEGALINGRPLGSISSVEQRVKQATEARNDVCEAAQQLQEAAAEEGRRSGPAIAVAVAFFAEIPGAFVDWLLGRDQMEQEQVDKLRSYLPAISWPRRDGS